MKPDASAPGHFHPYYDHRGIFRFFERQAHPEPAVSPPVLYYPCMILS